MLTPGNTQKDPYLWNEGRGFSPTAAQEPTHPHGYVLTARRDLF